MHRVFRTYRLILTFIVCLLAAGTTMQLGAMPANDAISVYEQRTSQRDCSTSSESHIISLNPAQGLAVVDYSSQGIAPVMRTVARNTRQLTRHDYTLVAVRSIDSTQAKSRAGLFNHKILFYTYSRHYYLNGLVRLII